MGPAQIYGIVASSMSALIFLRCFYEHISRRIQTRIQFDISKFLIQPTAYRRSQFLELISCWQSFLTPLYRLRTATCNILGLKTSSEVGNRAGVLSILYLISLSSSGQLSFAADLLRLSLKKLFELHGSVGFMATSQSFIHILICVIHNNFRITNAMAIRHLTTVLYYSRIIFRRIRGNKPCASTNLTKINNTIIAEIKVPRPWEIHAGDSVYIWMPEISPWSVLHSHLFMISWWDQEIHGGGATIYLHLKSKSAITGRCLRRSKIPKLTTRIDGPYGWRIKTGYRGKVMMFASERGIAAQVPYIKELLIGAKDYCVRTRKILLIWQIEKESKYLQLSLILQTYFKGYPNWVQNLIDQLLSIDRGSCVRAPGFNPSRLLGILIIVAVGG